MDRKRTGKALVTAGGIGLVAAAIGKELQQPPRKRTWHGRIFGLVPYDFRVPTVRRVQARWWNPRDERLFTPRVFGVGWAINLARLAKR